MATVHLRIPMGKLMLIEYIKGQEEHHRRTSFAEEYRKLLVEAGIEFDERYVM